MQLVLAYVAVAKASKKKLRTQVFMENVFLNARVEQEKLLKDKLSTIKFYYFEIFERGKQREIAAVDIAQKGIQNALSNNCLIPILKDSLIYDNGASLKGKGTDFALNRLEKHLHEYYRKFGSEGYIFFFDFKSYFANVNLDILKHQVEKYIFDEKILKLFFHMLDSYQLGGLGLGSQVSQISAVFYPNLLDHTMKDELGIKWYGRYMDDGYIICNSKEELHEYIEIFYSVCEILDIIPNKKKCKIFRTNKCFTFLKTRFFLTETGEVVRRLNRQASKNERARLREYKYLYKHHMISATHIYFNFHSWLLSQKRGKSYNARFNMIQFYNDLFSDCDEIMPYFPYKVTKREYKVLLNIAKQVSKEYGTYIVDKKVYIYKK